MSDPSTMWSQLEPIAAALSELQRNSPLAKLPLRCQIFSRWPRRTPPATPSLHDEFRSYLGGQTLTDREATLRTPMQEVPDGLAPHSLFRAGRWAALLQAREAVSATDADTIESLVEPLAYPNRQSPAFLLSQHWVSLLLPLPPTKTLARHSLDEPAEDGEVLRETQAIVLELTRRWTKAAQAVTVARGLECGIDPWRMRVPAEDRDWRWWLMAVRDIRGPTPRELMDAEEHRMSLEHDADLLYDNVLRDGWCEPFDAIAQSLAALERLRDDTNDDLQDRRGYATLEEGLEHACESWGSALHPRVLRRQLVDLVYGDMQSEYVLVRTWAWWASQLPETTAQFEQLDGLLEALVRWNGGSSMPSAVAKLGGHAEAVQPGAVPIPAPPPSTTTTTELAGSEHKASGPNLNAPETTSAQKLRVSERLNNLLGAGEPYIGQRKLAAKLGCSPSAVAGAIKKDDMLRAWSNTKARRTPKNAQPLNKALSDMLADRSDEPHDNFTDDQISGAIKEIKAAAKPEFLAEINTYCTVQLRSLAAAHLHRREGTGLPPLHKRA